MLLSGYKFHTANIEPYSCLNYSASVHSSTACRYIIEVSDFNLVLTLGHETVEQLYGNDLI